MSRRLPTRDDGKPLPDACRAPVPDYIEEKTDPMLVIPSNEELISELEQHALDGQGFDDIGYRRPL